MGKSKVPASVGSVELIDHMGSDDRIAQAARVSFGGGEAKNNERLIRYLMRHRHTSPFEMCELMFKIECPIFVARQWMRHRTASINEISGRYVDMREMAVYVPDEKNVNKQSPTKKQGRSKEIVYGVRDVFYRPYQSACLAYEELIEKGVAYELARAVLPLGTFTEFVWKIDLHNLLHFLELRMHTSAQWEIRQFAEAIAEIVEDLFPVTWKAFEDYRLNAVTLPAEVWKKVAPIIKNHLDKMTGDSPDMREFRELLNGDKKV